MPLYRQALSATGVANSTVRDDGIESTDDEIRKIVAVELWVSGQISNDVVLEIDRETIMTIPDYLIKTDESSGSTNVQKCDVGMMRFEVDHVLAVGEKLQAGIKCGATAKNLEGCYLYEVA